ncbi:MAG: hypothetical protein HDR03_00135 [Lachnospiraceae bacterium]|nr:hypothetical protein [Lachnospiraceae bacterium]
MLRPVVDIRTIRRGWCPYGCTGIYTHTENPAVKQDSTPYGIRFISLKNPAPRSAQKWCGNGIEQEG